MGLEGTGGKSRRLVVAAAILLAVMGAGIIGYWLIEDMSFVEALFMTVTTVFTVGFREVQPLSTTGMCFTVALILVGVGAMLYFVTMLFEFILNEYLGDIWGKRRMKNKIRKLVNHYVICGYGRVGRSVAEELEAHGRPFVVVDSDEEVFGQCVEDGRLAVHGSATDVDVLLEAGVGDATGVVSALPSDSDNLYVALTARVTKQDLIVVVRANEPGSEQKLEMVGADRVISPYRIAGKRMANLLTSPGACEFLDVVSAGNLPEYQLIEHMVDLESPLKGMTIKETKLRERTGITILAVRKEGESRYNPNPRPAQEIEKGDVLIMIGTPEQMELIEAGEHGFTL